MELVNKNPYAKKVRKELYEWEHEMLSPPKFTAQAVKALQSGTQALVPKKARDFITASIKIMMETILSGSALLTTTRVAGDITLAESDYFVEKAYRVYDKLAMAQGFGFGMGGIILGLADFPALLSIKVKFLTDCAKYYGFVVNLESERLFMLYIFELAFCSEQRRVELYPIIRNWKSNPPETIDWEKLQLEYRDYIDLAKLLQLLPVVGSVAGASANHKLLRKLKVTAMNSYRLRLIDSRE
jgi:hypothetical protein